MQERFEIEPIPEPNPDLFIFMVDTSGNYLAIDTGRLSGTPPKFISIKHKDIADDDLLLEHASQLQEHKHLGFLSLKQESEKILCSLVVNRITELIFGDDLDEMPSISVSIAQDFEGLASDEFKETFDQLRELGLLAQTKKALNIFRKRAIIQGNEISQVIWQDPNSIFKPQN